MHYTMRMCKIFFLTMSLIPLYKRYTFDLSLRYLPKFKINIILVPEAFKLELVYFEILPIHSKSIKVWALDNIP
jgi:hypothetical protein